MKKLPLRMCVGCREMKPKKDLVRVVKSPSKEGEENSITEISLDKTGKKPGRGAYVCNNIECLQKARKQRCFERTFSCKIENEIYDKLEEEIDG